ncbi:hypothetical protein AGMMS50262_17070 [Bacteroidia bacterium]|nr:hypothetical protein AGMMS50262_17070 [Bacteroidia bacterium]
MRSLILKYLLYLLPVFVVFQTIDGYNRLAYPWQGLSDITGIFDNTGIFGGFVAMGLVAALGLIAPQPPEGGVKEAKTVAVSKILLFLLLIPIVVQLIYTQSRAAWVAAIAGIYEHAKQEANYILNKKAKIDSPKIKRMKEEMQKIINRDN